MKIKEWLKENWWILTVLAFFILLALFGTPGCSGAGFEKRATLVPDSIGIGYNQGDNVNEGTGWPTGWTGFTINAQWDLK